MDQAPAPFEFEVFDRRATRYVKTPELTIQAAGSISLNAAAFEALGEPEAVEFLYDTKRKIIGLRPVDSSVAHAYPLRGVGKGGTGRTYVASPRAFFAYFEIPIGTPVRRDVAVVDGVLIVDLNQPGRLAISNRNRAKLASENESEADDQVAAPPTETPAQQTLG